MCISSSSTIILSCYYILLILFITSSYAYVIDSDDLKNSLSDQQQQQQHFALHLPSSYDRYGRATTFPRIGRSPSDVEEMSSLYDTNMNPTESEEINNENEFHWLDQRSVLFPRIGKRAFHNILWGNSYSNPHRMLDAQGRYHINGYDYQIHRNQPQSMFHFRGKRDLSM